MDVPGNAPWLEQLRKQGKVPSGLILISFVGRLGVDNFILYASPKQSYDWRVIKELRVCAVIEDGKGDATNLRPIAANARNGECHVWHRDKQVGAWIWPDAEVTDGGLLWIKPGVRSVMWTKWQNERFHAALNSPEEIEWSW
jgi:hypothetical protein